MEHNHINIERTVLASYFLLDYTQDAFKRNCREKLDKEIFVMPFHKRLAEKINEAIDLQEPLPYLLMTIQDKIVGSSYEDDLLLIEATNPLSLDCGLEWYINYLKEEKIKRKLG